MEICLALENTQKYTRISRIQNYNLFFKQEKKKNKKKYKK